MKNCNKYLRTTISCSSSTNDKQVFVVGKISYIGHAWTDIRSVGSPNFYNMYILEIQNMEKITTPPQDSAGLLFHRRLSLKPQIQ